MNIPVSTLRNQALLDERKAINMLFMVLCSISQRIESSRVGSDGAAELRVCVSWYGDDDDDDNCVRKFSASRMHGFGLVVVVVLVVVFKRSLVDRLRHLQAVEAEVRKISLLHLQQLVYDRRSGCCTHRHAVDQRTIGRSV